MQVLPYPLVSISECDTYPLLSMNCMCSNPSPCLLINKISSYWLGAAETINMYHIHTTHTSPMDTEWYTKITADYSQSYLPPIEQKYPFIPCKLSLQHFLYHFRLLPDIALLFKENVPDPTIFSWLLFTVVSV